MTFVTSRISFGGYNFPSGFYLDSNEQDTTMDVVKLPYQVGSNIPPGTLAEKIVSVKGMIGGSGSVDSSGAYIQTSDQLEAELQLLYSTLKSGYQSLNVGATPAKTLACQNRKAKVTYITGTGRSAADVELEFVAQDPRWISTAQTSTTALSGTLTSNGSIFTFPVFTITGASAGATISVTPLGAAGAIKLVLLNSTISSGSLLIDCDPRNRVNAVKLNGVVNLALVDYINSLNNVPDSQFFPYLQPGANTFASTGISAMTTSWSDAYVF